MPPHDPGESGDARAANLQDTSIPLLNYGARVARVVLHRVTDGERTFRHRISEFDTPRGRERKLHTLVGEDVCMPRVHRNPQVPRGEARGVPLETAAEKLEVDAADLAIDGRGNVHVRGAPSRSITVADASAAAQFEQGRTVSGRGIFLVPRPSRTRRPVRWLR